jgi:hypothetical protein
MMFDIYFIVSLFIFSVMCFFELIVFNEEILLALCFFSFIFFSFNSLGDSVFDTFQSRAAKFEEDLLISFSATKETLGAKFSSFIASRGFVAKFKVLSACVTNYLTVFTRFYSYKWFAMFYSASLSKLAELSIFETKLIAAFQEKCVSLLLYPLIFQTSKNNVALLTSAVGSLVKTSSSNKTKILSALSK